MLFLHLTVWKSVRPCARGWLSWSMAPSNVSAAYSISRTSIIILNFILLNYYYGHYRFGSGLILQAKVKLSPPPAAEVEGAAPPRRRSLLRRLSTIIPRRSNFTTGTGEEQEPVSQSPNQINSQPVSFRRQLSRRLSRRFSFRSKGAVSARKPQFNTAPLHQFVYECFPGASKLEEHQVPHSVLDLQL